MAKQRTPTKVLELRGTQKNHPERLTARKNEPRGDEFTNEPPSYFNKKQCEIWEEVVRMCPRGVLQESDRVQVEIVSRLLYDFRYFKNNVPLGLAGRLSIELNRLGMNPAGRSALVANNSEENRFER